MTDPSPSWIGQPRGLTVLFLTNMWEQFSYYGMRALLVYYMTKQLGLTQDWSSSVFGAYTACAYFTPIIGGAIADRWLGKRRAVIIGASVMAAGHFLMTFDAWFYVALTAIALGNGLFLPSLPSQVGDLYRGDDPRRGWAFNLYYLGINVGGLFAPLLCGWLGETYGWHYGFSAAGFGMLAGLLIYLAGQRHLPPEPPRAARGAQADRAPLGRETVLLLAAVALAVVVYRGAYEQIGNTVALWIDSGVDRGWHGRLIPETWFQAIDPLFVMLFTPPLLAVWRRRAAAGHQQSLARRMATGALITATGFALLALLVAASGEARVGWGWVVAFVALYTLGELFVLPTGLGLFAEAAPAELGATTLAAWFLTIFAGSLGAGQIGRLWGRMDHATYFALLACLGVAAAAMLWRIDPFARHVDALKQQASRNGKDRAETA